LSTISTWSQGGEHAAVFRRESQTVRARQTLKLACELGAQAQHGVPEDVFELLPSDRAQGIVGQDGGDDASTVVSGGKLKFWRLR